MKNKDIEKQPVKILANKIVEMQKRIAQLEKMLETINKENKKLEENEELYCALVDTSPDAIVLIDMDNRIIMANRQSIELLGYHSESDLLGRDAFEFIVSKDRERARDNAKKVFECGILKNIEYNFIRRDGAHLTGELSASLLLDKHGKPRGLITVTSDITERKQMEEELLKHRSHLEDLVVERTAELQTAFASLQQESAERRLAEEKVLAANRKLMDIIDFLPEATFVIDCEKKVIAWNRAMEEMTEISKEDILGRGDCAYAIPFYGKPRKVLVDFALEMNNGCLFYDDFERKGNVVHGSAFIPSMHGGKGAYLWGVASPLFDGEGNIAGAIESIRDITELKNFQDALRSSEELFSKAFKSSPGPMSICTFKEGRYMDVNDSFLRMTGYKREEVIGFTVLELNIWADPEEYLRIREMILEKGTLKNIEFKFRTKSGEVRIGLMSVDIINLCGEKCLLSLINDFTERKQLELEMARLERLHLVGEIAASIGHEVRNPMTTVRGFLQLLGNKEGCVKYREHFELMIEELDRANSIITEFLSLAKNKALDLKRQNLNSIINALFPLIEADAIKADKNVEIELGKITSLLLDEKEIRQLILNLVRNGLEAMSSGGKLTIRTYADTNDIILAVEDQGKGINPKILDKIGTPFLTTKEYGTGLGLAVCYSIAARHNAAIRVDTGPAGTTFFVRFEAD